MRETPLCVSVMDILWPGNAVALAIEIEKLGYFRYWATEHHARGQSGSPVVLAAIVAASTSTLRVGIAGVMLNFRSPLDVAEDFLLLELLFPGRIDAGVVRAGASPQAQPMLHDGRPPASLESYVQKIRTISHFLGYSQSEEQMSYAIALANTTVPRLWICGEGPSVARVAGQTGARYAYHHHLAQGRAKPDGSPTGPEITRSYLDSFVPSVYSPRPHVAITAFGFCAESEEVALRLWGRSARPSFIGTAAQCRTQLIELRDMYDANEIIIQSVGGAFCDRLRSYQLLAAALNLGTHQELSEP
jgi:luciferase family oxidoreductase group 1